MDKIKDTFSKLLEKIRNMSKGKKIAFSVLTIGMIIGIAYIIVFFNKTNYALLYGNADPSDTPTILAKINEKKIKYKIENSNIMVPEEYVSELRMELAPQLTGGSQGYEILDQSNTFGMTDKERNLKYKIAMEGELARNIMILPEVKKAVVLLVMPEEGNFFKEAEKAQASVTLEINTGKNITKDQVKAIVSLVTGSVKNLPKENVKVLGVVNGKTVDLADELYKDEESDVGSAIEKQQLYKSNLEKEYEKKILNLLSPKYGDGVKVAVDLDLDFDANEKTSITIDPNHVIKSQEISKSSSNTAPGTTSSGPVDNNMTSTYNNSGSNTQTSDEKQITNYDNGTTNEKTVSAPGKVKKISASVVVNNEGITEEERASINNLVVAAISYNQSRGDIISIEGAKFNNSSESAAAEEAAKLAEEEAANKKMLMYKYIGAGVAGFILLLIILISMRKAKKAKEMEEPELDGINILIDEKIEPKENLKPIDFEEENESTHVEKEIKKYATQKPDQVADIIKSWMAEDER